MLSRAKPRPKREREPDEFASYTPRPRPAAMATGLFARAPVEVAPKVKGRKVQAIRDAAKGEPCLVRIQGVCRGGTEHTIWSHAPLGAAGKGRGIKSVDIAGAMCCTACDAVVDGQAPLPPGATRQSVLLDWFMGHMRSLVRLGEKGLL